MAFAAKRKHELSASELIDLLRAVHVSGADLRSLVELTGQFVAEDLERRVAIAKASPDGRNLPEQVLANQLVKFDCHCKAALRWTANE
jgi:hypothetical protein